MTTYNFSIKKMVSDNKWKEIYSYQYSNEIVAMQEFRAAVRLNSDSQEPIKISCTEGRNILGQFSIK